MKNINVGDTVGITRKLDDLGRIVLPIEFRKELEIGEKSKIQMFLTKEGIFIKKGE